MQMIRACEHRRVKLMIGYRLHFECANLVAVELARGGELGEPHVQLCVLDAGARRPRRGAARSTRSACTA
jgi:predicted dehydrogenase